MSRDIGSDLVTESTSELFIFVMMVKLEFDAGNITLHNGLGNITYDGDTYLGVGDFGTISNIKETGDFSDDSVTLQLSGVDTALQNNALNADYYLRPVTVFIAPVSKTTGAMLGTPYQFSKGEMSSIGVALGSSDIIELVYETESAKFQEANDRRNSNADQQNEHSGDVFYEFTERVNNARIRWGSRVIVPGQGGFSSPTRLGERKAHK